jgi:uncharacterized membrane protein YdbT with pleckstrin-like domain
MDERQFHPSLRNSLSLIVWPVLAIPLGMWLIGRVIFPAKDLPTWVYLAWTGALLAFPLWAWIKSHFHTYMIKPESVYSREGLISRNYTEVRIPDIRAINVRQSGVQRIMNIGDVGFSSAAGDDEEVVFFGVRDPEGIKRQVQGQQKTLELAQKAHASSAGE